MFTLSRRDIAADILFRMRAITLAGAAALCAAAFSLGLLLAPAI